MSEETEPLCRICGMPIVDSDALSTFRIYGDDYKLCMGTSCSRSDMAIVARLDKLINLLEMFRDDYNSDNRNR